MSNLDDTVIDVYHFNSSIKAAQDLFHASNALTTCRNLWNTYQEALIPSSSLDQQKFYAKKMANGPIIDRAFAHILGDNYVQGTSLEGWTPLEAKKSLEDLAKDFPKNLQKKILSLTEKIRFIPRETKTKEEIADLALNIAKSIKSRPFKLEVQQTK